MSRSRLAVALALVAALAALAWLRPAPVPARPAVTPRIPLQVGAFTGRDLPLTERHYELLESRDILFREYADGNGVPVLACVAVAGGNRKVAHPPEVCYRGLGFEVLAHAQVERVLGGRQRRVQRLVVERDGESQLVLSWYRVAGRETPSYLVQQWLGLWADLRSVTDPSALVRLSAPVGRDAAATEQRLVDFCAEFLPILEPCFAAGARR